MESKIYFNSRPCERGFAYVCPNFPAIRFQFTPLREGLQFLIVENIADNLYFNSRPCERGFLFICQFSKSAIISIHAPARGASHISIVVYRCHRFQFTPLREGLPLHCLCRFHQVYFNSRPCERGFDNTGK